jgi:hypothetical protein
MVVVFILPRPKRGIQNEPQPQSCCKDGFRALEAQRSVRCGDGLALDVHDEYDAGGHDGRHYGRAFGMVSELALKAERKKGVYSQEKVEATPWPN